MDSRAKLEIEEQRATNLIAHAKPGVLLGPELCLVSVEFVLPRTMPPQLRGLLNARLMRDLIALPFLAGSGGFLWYWFVMKPRREVYAEFYKNYDAQAVAKKMEEEQGECPVGRGVSQSHFRSASPRSCVFRLKHEMEKKTYTELVDVVEKILL